MEYLKTENGSSCDLKFIGKLTFSDGTHVLKLIDELEASSISDCSIDLSELDSIDSSGLGMLLLVNNAAKDFGKNVCLSGAKGQVQKMLELSKFSEIVPIK